MKWEYMKCFDCGGEAILIKKRSVRYDGINVENVYFRNVEVEYCRSCGIESPVVRNIKGVHAKIALALALQPGRMKGAEVRFLRKAMRLNSEAMAERVGMAAETYSRWENGRSPSVAIEKLLRMNFLATTDNLIDLGRLLENDFSSSRDYGFVIDAENQEQKAEYLNLDMLDGEVPSRSNIQAHTLMPAEIATVVGIGPIRTYESYKVQSAEGEIFDANPSFAIAA